MIRLGGLFTVDRNHTHRAVEGGHGSGGSVGGWLHCPGRLLLAAVRAATRLNRQRAGGPAHRPVVHCRRVLWGSELEAEPRTHSAVSLAKSRMNATRSQ